MNRKDKIVEVAFLLFLKNGFDRVSLNEIIKKADITTGGFYYYFPSKENLIVEVIDKYIFFYFNAPFEEIKNAEISSKEKVKRYLAKSIGYDINKEKFTNVTASYEKIDYKELYLLYFGSLQKYDILKDKYNNNIIFITNTIKKLIDQGIELGEVRNDIDSKELSSLILSIFSGTISSWIVMEDMNLYNSFSDHLDFFWEKIL